MAKVKKSQIARDSHGLRDGLFDEWDRLVNGESNPQQAQAVSKLACQIINSVKAEIEFQSHVRSLEGSEITPTKALQLGKL